ncbi:Hypothetical protein NTJ_15879 [Nesidiocoris tenuis]|uniref:MD-2-related lipid-recognition domain-containing protein n=1 Tax=Nesidiocoris tenuis TaxID=355587 RepID=A0ABN7BFB0_9HEMI|nr:Hypothetical protein NTJ_15879 [Nesidiocoris tenuis]
MASSLKFVLILSICLFWVFEAFSEDKVMGPARVQMKFVEKCKFTLPTFIESNLRIVERRNKALITFNASFPYKFSDKVGYECGVDVKRNGAWIPNFMKKKGKGLCSGVKNAEMGFFKKIAESLHAESLDCPLPSGNIVVIDHVLDVERIQAAFVGNVLPYGEYRISMNMTHNGDVGWCFAFLIAIVPKHESKRG